MFPFLFLLFNCKIINYIIVINFIFYYEEITEITHKLRNLTEFTKSIHNVLQITFGSAQDLVRHNISTYNAVCIYLK